MKLHWVIAYTIVQKTTTTKTYSIALSISSIISVVVFVINVHLFIYHLKYKQGHKLFLFFFQVTGYLAGTQNVSFIILEKILLKYKIRHKLNTYFYAVLLICVVSCFQWLLKSYIWFSESRPKVIVEHEYNYTMICKKTASTLSYIRLKQGMSNKIYFLSRKNKTNKRQD